MSRPCPACGSTVLGPPQPAGDVSYVVCRSCGTAVAGDHPDFDRYYETYFPEAVREDSPVLARRYAALLEELEADVPERSLLEVGCGNGQLLAVAAGRGWTVAGTELSRAQVDHCRRRGLDVELGDLARDEPFPGRSFGAVVLIEVYEHLSRPSAVLAAAGERLVPGGILHLTTPNYGALSRRLLGGQWSVLNHEHVTLATARGLARSLDRAGLVPVRIGSRNVNVTELRESLLGPGDGPMTSGERVAAAAATRDRIERSRLLRLAKAVANMGLGLTGLGDTLVARARKER